jgi:tetratricopeptide (TPR) repeat protein
MRLADEANQEALTLARQLIIEFPESTDFQHELAATHFSLAHSRENTSRPKEAQAELHEAIVIQTQLVDGSDSTPLFRQELARSYLHLGLVHSDAGHKAEAEAAYRKAHALDRRLVEEYPDDIDYAVSLGAVSCNLGNLFQGTDRAAESLVWYESAIAVIEPCVKSEPNLMKPRLFLRNCHGGRAQALGKLNRHAEAVKDWDQAVELSPPPQRPMVQIDRALCLARAGEPVLAAQAAEEVLAAPKLAGGLLYDAASVFALSAGAATIDADLRAKYAARALEALLRAQAAGFFKLSAKIEQLKKDGNFDALQDREEFRKLLEKLKD